jgi:hypothetical protein
MAIYVTRPTPNSVIRAHAEKLAYLGDVSKVMMALSYEYGSDRPMPSRAAIQAMIDKHKRAKFSRGQNGTRRA